MVQHVSIAAGASVPCRYGAITISVLNTISNKHAEEAKLSEHLDGYRIGCCIDHPVYGVGTIKNIIGESVSRCIMVDISGVGIKNWAWHGLTSTVGGVGDEEMS